MPGFEDAWAIAAKVRDGESVSSELKPLLRDTYTLALAEPKDLPALKKCLQSLLQHLAGPGRTNANCWAVDLFFMNAAGWESDWCEQELPEEFHDILAKMGEALHDTVHRKDIAENFGCLPEQLLENVNRLKVAG